MVYLIFALVLLVAAVWATYEAVKAQGQNLAADVVAVICWVLALWLVFGGRLG